MRMAEARAPAKGQTSSIKTWTPERVAGAWIQKHPLIRFGVTACKFGFECKQKLGVDWQYHEFLALLRDSFNFTSHKMNLCPPNTDRVGPTKPRMPQEKKN
jgi:hypothetical protein